MMFENVSIVEISSEEPDNWLEWVASHTNDRTDIDIDFGLSKIANHFGKSSAVDIYWNGAAREADGDVEGAIEQYRRAFKLWPALDSVTYGGLPRGVREDAEAAGLSLHFLDIVDVTMARDSCVMHCKGLLNTDDIAAVEAVRGNIEAKEGCFHNNPQNSTHKCKTATFMNNPPDYLVRNEAPQVIGKMLRFAMAAWEQGNWSGTPEQPGPLYAIRGGVPSLSIRVVEHWKYDVNGGLEDPLHYDVDSVLTVVVLLVDPQEFDGGVFRTNETDGTHLEHSLAQGDAICFVSHKFHNITPLTRGVRKSLVMELWQGGIGHSGR